MPECPCGSREYQDTKGIEKYLCVPFESAACRGKTSFPSGFPHEDESAVCAFLGGTGSWRMYKLPDERFFVRRGYAHSLYSIPPPDFIEWIDEEEVKVLKKQSKYC